MFRTPMPFALGFLVWGCAAPQTPPISDASALRFGLDPQQEAEQLERHLARHGRRVVDRIDGHNYSALALQDVSGDGSGVRIITERGTQVALDAGAAHGKPRLRLALLPMDQQGDLDDDGRDEVFVVGEDLAGDIRCLQAYRIYEGGFIAALGVTGLPWAHPFCVESLASLEGRAGLHGWVRIRLDARSPVGPPSLLLPVTLGAEGFAWEPDHPAVVRHLAQERRRLEAELVQARARQDVDAAYRLGVSLAVHAHFSGQDADMQRAMLQRALEGLPLTDSQTHAVSQTEREIHGEWDLPSSD